MRLAASAVFFVASSGLALGQWATTTNVAMNKEIRLTFSYSTNPDCSSNGEAEIRIKTEPNHGRIQIRKEKSFPYFPAENPRNVCNTRRVPGISVFYMPERNYTGSDGVSYDILYPTGKLDSKNYNIIVQ